MNKLLFTIVLVVSYTSAIFGESEFAFTNIRSEALGGVRITTEKNIHALYANPALLENAQTQPYFPFGINIGASQELLEKGTSTLADFGKATSDSQRLNILSRLIPSSMALRLSTMPMGWTQRGFGMGIFSASDAQVILENPADIKATLKAYGDIGANIGMSQHFDIMGTPVAMGLSLKYTVRSRVINARYGTPYFEFVESDLINGKELPVTADGKLVTMSSIGGDVGITFPFIAGEMGIVVNNIASSLSGPYTTSRNVKKNYSEPIAANVLGIGYSQNFNAKFIPWAGKWIGDVQIMGEYRCVEFNSYKNVSLGLEKILFNNLLAIRFGLHQGYPTAGFGLDLSLIRLQYAFTTTEYSDYLGEKPISFHKFEISVPFY